MSARDLRSARAGAGASSAQRLYGSGTASGRVLRGPLRGAADTAAAWDFLNDPDYQPVKDIRFSVTSRGQMVVAPEFKPAR